MSLATLSKLRSGVWRERWSALKELGNLPPRQLGSAVATLVSMLQDDDWRVRQQTLEVLSNLSNDQLAPYVWVIKGLEHDLDWAVRLEAAKILQRVAMAKLEEVKAEFEGENPIKDSRREQQQPRATPAFEPRLEELKSFVVEDDEHSGMRLKSDSPNVRGGATLTPEEVRSQVEADISTLGHADDEEISRVIARLQQVPAGGLLTQSSRFAGMLEHPRSQVRSFVIHVLTSLGSATVKGHLPRIVELVMDEDWGVRNAAVDALSSLPSDILGQCGSNLAAGLMNDDPEVCQATMEIMCRLHPDDLEPHVLQVLNLLLNPDFKIRCGALKVLQQVPPKPLKEHISRITPLLNDDDWIVRLNALKVLGAMQMQDIRKHIRLIIDCFNDEDWSVRLAASELLDSLGIDSPVNPSVNLQVANSREQHSASHMAQEVRAVNSRLHSNVDYWREAAELDWLKVDVRY